MGRRHEERRTRLCGRRGSNELLHRGGELREPDRLVGQLGRVGLHERLEVGDEVTGLRQFQLGQFVVAAENCVVGALEQFVFAVLHELLRGLESSTRDHHRGGDVVFHLHLGRGVVVLPQPEDAPCAVTVESNPEEACVEFAVVALQFVAGTAVHDVDGEMGPPIVNPTLDVMALYDEHDLFEILGNRSEPGVEFGGVLQIVRGQELDNGAK